MLHGLEECRTLGVDDAFQSELREGPLWKTACERPHLAGKRLIDFESSDSVVVRKCDQRRSLLPRATPVHKGAGVLQSLELIRAPPPETVDSAKL